MRQEPPGGRWSEESRDDLHATMARARQAWLEVMGDYKTGPGIVRMPGAPALRPEHVARAQVTASREQMLETLPKEGAVAEVGVARGRFSATILDIVRPRRLHLFDSNLEFARERFSEQVEAEIVELHEGLSWERLPDLADGELDFVYIDADHRYAGVKRDIDIARRKIKDDGCLVFNDYTYWSPLECMKYGVVEAVNELCLDDNWEIVCLSLAAQMYCDVVVRRMRG